MEISLHDNAHHILDFIAQGKRSFNTWNCKSPLPVSLFLNAHSTHLLLNCLWIELCKKRRKNLKHDVWGFFGVSELRVSTFRSCVWQRIPQCMENLPGNVRSDFFMMKNYSSLSQQLLSSRLIFSRMASISIIISTCMCDC